MPQSAKRIAIASVFGVVIFVTKAFVPSPINKIFIVIQALLLAIGSLISRKHGATYVALIGGILTALWNMGLAPFTFSFALLFGLLVDGFFFLFRVNIVDGQVETIKLVAAMTLSTMLVGVLSYYTTAHLMGLMPRNLLMETVILAIGTISGSVAGYLASHVWNGYLKNVKF